MLLPFQRQQKLNVIQQSSSFDNPMNKEKTNTNERIESHHGQQDLTAILDVKG
jgi:hypothetical protein